MTTTMPIGVDRASDGADRIRQRLASGELRRLIERFVRRRVRGADVDDVVQTVLCDALAAERTPVEERDLRRWLIGIARHKVADLHRRSGRERVGPTPELSEPAPPVEQRAMIGWAERQAPPTTDGRQTLDWLAREGEGEKLAAIADDAKLPAAQVRQRVSRLRRLLRERWVAELAAVAAVAIVVLAVWRLTRTTDPGRDAIVPEPPSALVPKSPSPVERAATLRAEATEQCDGERWQRCLELLDEAARLDPAGERQPAAQGLRARAARATQPEPVQSASPLKEPRTNERPAPPPTTTTWPTKAPAPPPVQQQSTPSSLDDPSSPPSPNAPQKPGPAEPQRSTEPTSSPPSAPAPTTTPAPANTSTAPSAAPPATPWSGGKRKSSGGDGSDATSTSFK